MNQRLRLPRVFQASLILIGAGLSFLLVGVVAAQSQLPGTALVSDSANNFRPVWSPDGMQIAFFSNRSGDNDIWLINKDGSDEHQLTSGPADDRQPSWSPDGKWIVFDSDRAGNKDIWVVNTAGGDPLQVTSGPSFDNFPSWSPDGKQIAYFGYQDGVLNLWVVSIGDVLQGGQAGQPHQVMGRIADERQEECTYACHNPAWSPNGQEIAYTGTNHTQVWMVGVDGSNPHAVEGVGSHVHFPWWAPDGRLLMLSEHKNDQQEPVNDIWSVDSDGAQPTLLFADIPHGGPFYWNPTNTDLIAFHSPRAGSFGIYITDLSQDEALVTEAPPLSQAAEPEIAETADPQATAVALAPSLAEADPVTDPVQAAPAALWYRPWIWVAAVFVLGGLALAVYLFRKHRTQDIPE